MIQFFESSKPDHTKSWLYGLCSLSYVGAMVSSNSALQYVNYPTQVSMPYLNGSTVTGYVFFLFSMYVYLCLGLAYSITVFLFDRFWGNPANPYQVNRIIISVVVLLFKVLVILRSFLTD